MTRTAALLLVAASLTACSSETRENQVSQETAIEYGPGHAMARLVAEVPALEPGKTDTLGISLDIEPGWHLYWDGQNDTGYPVTVDLELPEGFTTGDLLWPAPRRHVSTGDILDHIYENQVTLLLPVHIPEDAAAGEWAIIQGTVQWLSCRDVCIPGQGRVALSLLVADRGSDAWQSITFKPGDAGRRINQSRERIPVIPGPDAQIAWKWAGRELILECTKSDYLAFYPGRRSVAITGLIESGESRTETLSLSLDENPGDATSVTGVLEVQKQGTTLFYSMNIPLPE